MAIAICSPRGIGKGEWAKQKMATIIICGIYYGFEFIGRKCNIIYNFVKKLNF